MASLENIDSLWNDDLPWGFGEEPKNSEEKLVVLTLLPEEPVEPQKIEDPAVKQSWGSPDWS